MKKFIVKLFKLGILIFILSLLTVAGFFVYLKLDANGVFMTKEEKHFYQKLKEFKESGKESIALKELTNFEWDEACYRGTYSPSEEPSYLKLYLKNKDSVIIDSHNSYFGYLIQENSYFSFQGSTFNCFEELNKMDNKVRIALKSHEIYPSINHYWVEFIN